MTKQTSPTEKYRRTTEDELGLILEEGEGYTLEFKESVNSDLAKEMVAFANASGGRILIGVNDDGRIVGCDTSNKMLSQIQYVASSCDPAIAIEIEKLAAHKVLVVHVSEGANRPHRCTKGFYLRNGANSQKMNTADITAFVQSEGRVRFDKQLRLDLNWKEVLDESRLLHFLNLSNLQTRDDKASLLANLDVGDYKGGEFYLNQTGVLFFAKEPTRRLSHATIVCAIFKGSDRVFILDRKEFSGSLIENVDNALLYLRQHLNTRFEITGKTARRTEILELPEVALREALVNAVTHRDYFEEGASVSVEIFDDRVDIYNPGGLPKGLPLSQFGERSVCRNPLIASLMLRCEFIEKMGTGIRRIKEAVSSAGCPDVKILTEGIFTISFPRNPEYAPTAGRVEAKSAPSRDQDGTKSGLSRDQVEILRLCQTEQPIVAMLALAGRTNRTKFRDQVLNGLLALQFLEMTIPDKPNSRLQKYRITHHGRQELEKATNHV